MKLVVLAQIPPPVHGQSVMVGLLVAGLPAHGLAVHHVPLALSRDSADVGRWRWGKVPATVGAALRAIGARLAGHGDTLYYVPAPPRRRGALWRDWVILGLCRPFFPRLVLHWHAVGLGAWLATSATSLERWLSHWLLGGADLAIVLSPALRADAVRFAPRACAVVPNGVPDPGPGAPPPSGGPFHLLFLGLGGVEKGLFAAAEAVLAANRQAGRTAFRLTAAGPFADDASRERFGALVAAHPGVLAQVGEVAGDAKAQLWAACHALCLPTTYPAEGLPLVVLEALARDRPVLGTAWRALPDAVDASVGRLVAPGDPDGLFAALLDLRDHPPAAGAARARYLARYTPAAHLGALAEALRRV